MVDCSLAPAQMVSVVVMASGMTGHPPHASRTVPKSANNHGRLSLHFTGEETGVLSLVDGIPSVQVGRGGAWFRLRSAEAGGTTSSRAPRLI